MSFFSWPAYPSLEYATPRPEPTSTTTIASPTDFEVKYGNVAWSSLWAGFNVTAPPFTTTRAATPIPSSELVKPTPLPFPTNDGITDNYAFPKGFLYGFSGAALQIEGAVKNEGRGPAFAEQFLISRQKTAKGGGAPDITNLNYYLYKQDIARLAAVGVQTYSFSISWSRILPFGVEGSPVNQEGIDHYNDLINTILEYGMVPMATLNHFDTPITLATNTSWQGWDHPSYIPAFLNYARIVLTHYSDRVPYWITFNEPTSDASITRNYLSAYNIAMAHASVVHFYRNSIGGSAQWSLKLSFSEGFGLPLDPFNPSDVEGADRYLDFTVGYLANPLYLGLPVPESVSSTLGDQAPVFTEAELEFINGTCNFLAFDLYSVRYQSPVIGGIEACAGNSSDINWPVCTNATFARDGWNVGMRSNSGGYITPQHLRTVFSRLYTTYHRSLMITEFGYATFFGSSMTSAQEAADLAQSIFYQSTLNEVLKSVHEDEVPMLGVVGWAFVNNWEWGEYDDKYGVQGFSNITLERWFKRGIFDFVDFVIRHGGS
ncbi:glycoside hydrolase family 1 protein [Cadophora sp. DSE1049]|nr:glycoside hydrolase family 1 protein [Cadophora sp. DSE1049]